MSVHNEPTFKGIKALHLNGKVISNRNEKALYQYRLRAEERQSNNQPGVGINKPVSGRTKQEVGEEAQQGKCSQLYQASRANPCISLKPRRMWQPPCNSTAGMVSWEKAGESGWTRRASTGAGEVQEKLFQVGEERDMGAQLSYNTQLSICEALNFIPRPKQIWVGRGGKEDIL